MHKVKKVIPLLILTIAVIFLSLILLFKDRPPALTTGNRNINILLLGIAGGDYAGANLTDTIILMSINQQKNEVVLVSIPRDIYLTEVDGKINTAYALGEEKKKGGGLILVKAIVSEITGLPIDYAVKIDFAGFKRATDLVGGLDIDVANTFQDFGYPIPGKENDLCGAKEEDREKLATASDRPWEIFPCRFEHIYFSAGRQHMDGETALKFVRSRNAEGDEGTDFARSRRQQKVITAFKKNLLGINTLSNPLKIISLYKISNTNINTDIQLSLFDNFISIAQKMKDAKVRNAVIGYGNPEKGISDLLTNPPLSQYGAWVLIPRRGENDFLEIQEYIRCQIESANCPIK